ncbi:flagellar biosynthesis protein FliQ [Zymobacter palmae]|uniref:Flagellar biosynthetic protein FliQ n=1 Tax=Zymobacter palmae TaxID=33074 RepID=A0A348HFF3_9GAMM|nr:flagellar biosynthesis protein FliQ [Zymobacter palmae]BBG30355.1 flagellar biosynthesis pathway, component [Zymobacter palmae]
MTPETVIHLGYQAMKLTLIVSAPILLTALAVGLLVSLFQAATQINEMTLSFIPKILAIVAIIILTGPWVLGTLGDFTRNLFHEIPQMIG